MKKNYLFMGLLALAAAFTACSSEDTATNESKTNPAGKSYLAVTISSPNNGSTRAVNENGYEDGTDAENNVTKATFVFFDSGDKVQQVSTLTDDELKPWTDGNVQTVSKISSAVLIVDGEKSAPSKVVAILNNDVTFDNGTSLSDVMKKTADYSAHTDGNFVMSNSVFDGTDGNAVTILPSDLKESADAAKKAPINIFVERTVAKIEYGLADDFVNDGTEVEIKTDVDGAGSKVLLKPEITGYKIVGTNPVSYLMKDIEGINFTWNWNDPTNHRSYWANSAVPEEYAYPTSWTGTTEKTLPATEYVQENTSDPTNAAYNSSTNTTLLVTAQLKDPDGNAYTILKYKGAYYSEAGFKKMVSGYLKNYRYKISDGKYSNAWEKYVKVDKVQDPQDLKKYVVKAVMTDDAPEATKDDPTTVETPVFIPAADALASLNLDNAWQWTDGKTYYYVEIADNDAAKLKGVVRNHVYKLTLTSIKSLGTPVYDPDEVIKPEKPNPEEEPDYYVGAKINVLKWRIVKQDAVLE